MPQKAFTSQARMKRYVMDGAEQKYVPPVRLNRSRKWPECKTYAEARRQSKEARAV